MQLGKMFGAWFAICAVVALATAAFVVWVIIKLMAHFGVI